MVQTRLFERRIQSISYKEDEIIKDILKLHSPAGEIDLDPTYSKGVIYRGSISEPKMKFDLSPVVDDCQKADCKSLPIDSESIGCIMFDPPFLISMEADPDNIMCNRFSRFSSWDELVGMYEGALKEFFRILYKKGIVIFKCQDVINGGYQFFSHVAVMQLAIDAGFYPKDLFILMKKNRLSQPATQQRHARKHHSYYWVFEKSNKRVYSITK